MSVHRMITAGGSQIFWVIDVHGEYVILSTVMHRPAAMPAPKYFNTKNR